MKNILLFTIFSVTFSANAQWVQTNGPFGGQRISCLAISGTKVFAGTDCGMFISSNNGDLWTQINNGLTVTEIWSLAISNSNIFVGTSAGVFLSTNNGNSWTPVNNGLPGNNIVFSLVTKGTKVFAGLYQQGSGSDGVYMSGDNGNSWTAVNNGLPVGTDGYHEIIGLGSNGTSVFAAPRMSGMFASNDDGGSWTAVNNGFQYDPNRCSIAADDSNIVVGNFYGIFYSNNNGVSWTHHTSSYFNNGVLAVALNGKDLFAGTNDGVCLSKNNGSLWTNVSTNGIANQGVNSFAISGTHIFAGTSNCGVWTRPLCELTGTPCGNKTTILNQNVPNPSAGQTIINYDIPKIVSSAQIIFYNSKGVKVKSEEIKTAGPGQLNINASDLSNGIYTYSLVVDGKITETRRMIKEQ